MERSNHEFGIRQKRAVWVSQGIRTWVSGLPLALITQTVPS